MIELDPAIKVLNRPAGMTFSPDKRTEITHLEKLVQNLLLTLPKATHTNEPRHGEAVFHRDPHAVGSVILGALTGVKKQDLLNGTTLPSIKFTGDEAVLLQAAATTFIGDEAAFVQREQELDPSNVINVDEYRLVASQILAVNLQRAA